MQVLIPLAESIGGTLALMAAVCWTARKMFP